MMNGNLYQRNFVPNYNPNQQNMYEQTMYEQIDNQINQLVGMRNQIKNNAMQQNNQQHQPTAINQTFQLAPGGNAGMKYANSIEDVSKEMVFYDTPFFTKDLSVVWIKNAKGEIKTFELTEIIPQDEKDIEIALLKAELEQMRKERSNDEQFNSNANAEQIETNATTIDESIGKPIKASKSASVSRVSKSKAE